MAVKHDDQPDADRLSITASNLGPIDRAAVQLRPLTVFAGPSNTGKTWLATLLYALHRFAFRQAGNIDHTDCRENWQAFANSTAGGKAPPSVADQLIQFWSSKKQLGILHRHFANCDRALGEEICRCYGLSDPANLANAASANGHGLNISIKQGASLLQEITLNKTSLAVSAPSSRILQGQIAAAARRAASKLSAADAHIKQLALTNFLTELHQLRYGTLQGRAWYLPTDRSGIIHARDALASSIIRQAAPPSQLTGVAADFVDQVFHADLLAPSNRNGSNGSAHPGKMAKIAKFIEDKIIGGKIVIDRPAMINQPIISYQPNRWRKNTLALSNTAAMVSELAALVILLRYLVKPGDVLIFEETESGLHPAKQAELVDVITAIVNAGVTVIMTTHSDWVSEKISAVALASQQPHPAAPGTPVLSANQVGVWQFQNKGAAGSVVKQVPLDEDGIYETGYMRVVDQLYDEWNWLSTKIVETGEQASN